MSDTNPPDRVQREVYKPAKFKKAKLLYLKGLSTRAIAVKLKLGPNTVMKWRKMGGWEEERQRLGAVTDQAVFEEAVRSEAKEKLDALKALASIRKISIAAILEGDGSGSPLRPKRFSEAVGALATVTREESEIGGWKAASPQMLTIILNERKWAAEFAVRAAVSLLLPFINEKDRAVIVPRLKEEMDRVDTRLEEEPTKGQMKEAKVTDPQAEGEAG